MAAGEASGEIGGSHTTGDSVQRKVLRSNAALIRYIIEQEKVIVLDDFHYIGKDSCLYILDPFLLFYLRWSGVGKR